MGLLNRFFRSTEAIAKEIVADEESLRKLWDQYLATVPKKIDLIKAGDFQEELKRLLDLELVDISTEEKTESEIIKDLETVEHSMKVKRVKRLRQCLCYVETRYEYVYTLLHQLYSVLMNEMHILKCLPVSKDPQRLISNLRSQLVLEVHLLRRIKQIETFHSLFLGLVKGEHIIKTMDATEQRLIKRLQKGMNRILSGDLKEGITYEWAIRVFNRVQDIVEDQIALMAKGLELHVDVEFEYVNRPEFVDLVRNTIHEEKKVSEQMINAFVHIFREWYNHERC